MKTIIFFTLLTISSLYAETQNEKTMPTSSIEVMGQQSGYRVDPKYCPDQAVACGEPGGKVAFQIHYINQELPWGSKVELLRGFSTEDWCGGCEPSYDYYSDWQYSKTVEMKADAPWTWSANTEELGYASGAGGRFIALEFVIKITYPDGSIRWDNGGSSYGHYKVDVPKPLFELSWQPFKTYDSAFKPMEIQIVK